MAPALGGALRSTARAAVDLVLPPRCLSCGIPVVEPGTLCGACWPTLCFIAAPLCAVCGIPFVFAVAQETICADCLRQPPRYDRARSVLRYDAASRNLVIAFKHGDRTDAAPTFAGWLARAADDLLDERPLIVPVPLHRARLFARRFNQAALLSSHLARLTENDWLPDGLIRRRRTRSQGHLNPTERRRNVAGAFVLNEAARAAVAGRRVVLVDDVLTTGATAEACAGVLQRGGASAVDVLTLARVISGESGPTAAGG